MTDHEHQLITVRDEDGTPLYRECVERGCSRRIGPAEHESLTVDTDCLRAGDRFTMSGGGGGALITFVALDGHEGTVHVLWDEDDTGITHSAYYPATSTWHIERPLMIAAAR